MLELQRQYHTTDAVHGDKHLELQSQIESLDTQIDQQVYALYGLTTDEIAIIEGGHSAESKKPPHCVVQSHWHPNLFILPATALQKRRRQSSESTR